MQWLVIKHHQSSTLRVMLDSAVNYLTITNTPAASLLVSCKHSLPHTPLNAGS
jgi:hypothetical protein